MYLFTFKFLLILFVSCAPYSHALEPVNVEGGANENLDYYEREDYFDQERRTTPHELDRNEIYDDQRELYRDYFETDPQDIEPTDLTPSELEPSELEKK